MTRFAKQSIPPLVFVIRVASVIGIAAAARAADRPACWMGTSLSAGNVSVTADPAPAGPPTASHSMAARSVTEVAGGSDLRSWPVAIGQNFGSPMFHDLDGDGVQEVIAADRQRTYVLDSNGNSLPGWPVASGEVNNTPAVADLDEDGSPEIIVASSGAPPRIRVYNVDGTSQAGFPVSLPYQNWLNVSAPAVGDVDGDGHLDVGAQTEPGVAFFDRAGHLLPGWPYTWMTSQNIVWSAPAIADLDGDGSTEVVVGNNNLYSCAVHVIRSDGSAMPGWPRPTQNIFSSAAVGDLDGDGTLEIVIQEGDPTWYGNRMHVWRPDGSVLPGWPREISPQWESSRSNPAIADVDGDGNLEIVTATSDAMLHVIRPDGMEIPGYPRLLPVYDPISSVQVIDVDRDGIEEFFLCHYQGGNHWVGAFRLDGSMLPGFPKLLYANTGLNAHGSVHVVDLEGDGDLDLCAQGSDFSGGLVWLYEVDGSAYDPATSRADWPKIRRDARNTGCYPRLDPAGVEGDPAFAPDLTLFPNPARRGEAIRIRLRGGSSPSTVRIFDLSGRDIGGASIPAEGGLSLAIEDLLPRDPAAGVYLLRVDPRSGDRSLTTRLVILPR